jgi:hypothetical protein
VQLGFRIQQSSKLSLQKFLAENILKFPAEQIQVATVSGSVDESGMNVGISTTLNNCTGISLLMNSHPNEITAYRNIMYRGVYMKVNDTQYPNKNMNTIGSVFYKTIILASDLEEYGLAPTEEFENSISIPRNDELGNRINMTSDATNFILHLQTERNGCGYFYDGLHSNGANIPISFHGSPLYSGGNDVYYVPNTLQPNQHPPNPHILFTNDALWIYKHGEGLRFVYQEDLNNYLS